MGYLADPGGVFASDTHRRVLAHLPLPGDEPIVEYDDTGSYREQRRSSLYHRVALDAHSDLTPDELADVLADLQADGYASKSKAGGWAMTQAGLDALQAPVPVQEG